jgi:hypothetical protein
VINVPRVRDALTIGPLEAVGCRSNGLLDYEGAFPRCRKLVHVFGALDLPQDQVTNIEGMFPHVAVVLAT